ncbi:TetR/AcrR family transcriptional regulator [Streptomyces sp. NPDC058691]|uniref:TetR/AcrR family transcriptional regulator n=1 Tax=Streptomyces sp. NPDC058691 TaxID=3346601 RepID=UPI003667EF09
METENSASGTRRRGGRGARERILRAAAKLFYEEGIHATGVARLVETAEVSTRTFYQHFPTKTALVEEYLRDYETGLAQRIEQHLTREGLTPKDQLLALFTMVADAAQGSAGTVSTRGCPLHNAAVEAAGSMPDVRELVQHNKQGIARQLTEIAARAGAAAPEQLGRHLVVLLEGATALSTSLDSPQPRHDALEAARVLVDLALPETRPAD